MSHKFLVVVWMIKSFWVDVDFVANPPSRKKVRGKKFMWKTSVRKIGPNVRQPTDPQSVILNLFQDLLEGARVKEKRFRNKFGMTRTETVAKK